MYKRQINHRARYDAADFIAECERTYHAQVDQVAEEIAENSRQKPIVLINGPSSSGKTTTNDRIGRALEKRGIHAEMISMDDYYRTVGSYDIPPDTENGVPDLESPECMDLPLLSQHLTQLVAGEEIDLPRFDFETRTSIPHARSLRLDPDEVVLDVYKRQISSIRSRWPRSWLKWGWIRIRSAPRCCCLLYTSYLPPSGGSVAARPLLPKKRTNERRTDVRFLEAEMGKSC